jgi:hypothetical protein
MKSLLTLKNGFQFRLGNGTSSFWFTNWSGYGTLASHMLYVDILDIEMRVKDVFIYGDWNFNLLYTVLPAKIKDSLAFLPVNLS